MHRLYHCYLSSGLLAFAVVLAGCTQGSSIKTEYVEGVVTLDGKPVAGATVMFVPVTEGQGMSATGYTDENGVYTLTAVATGGQKAETGGGTLPGEYYVSVVKAQAETPMTQEEAEEKGVEYEAPSVDKGPEVKFLVPEKYKLAQTSGLKVTVKEGENNIPLELTSD